MNYFEISGYWKDNQDEFEGLVVTDYDDFDEDNHHGLIEDDIFYFGISENEIIDEIKNNFDPNRDFVITDYKKL